MAADLTTAKQLQHVTSLVKADNSVGTGFFYSVELDDGTTVPLLITNRHVIEGSTNTRFQVTVKGEDGQPEFGNSFFCESDTTFWKAHPDPDIDLAMLMVGPLLNRAARDGKHSFVIGLTWDEVASQEYLADMDAIENIVMVGYPTGVFDEKNNLPVTRRGITASRIGLLYNGKPEFLIDCACFPGSSGSPVFHYDTGPMRHSDGTVYLTGVKFKFVGILWGGPLWNARGEVSAVPIETATKQVASTNVMTNLGYCIRAEQLQAFHKLAQDFISGLDKAAD